MAKKQCLGSLSNPLHSIVLLSLGLEEQLIELLAILAVAVEDEVRRQQESPEYHLILSEGASLIRKNIRYPAQLLRNVTVPALAARHLFIIVD